MPDDAQDVGARQVGKTTVVEQVLGRLGVPSVFVSADEPTVGDTSGLDALWNRARIVAADAGGSSAVLAIDEAQKVPRWSETVKRLWDEDSRARRPLRVVLLGSAPLLLPQGLSDSLAGRFEVTHLPHWSYAPCASAARARSCR